MRHFWVMLPGLVWAVGCVVVLLVLLVLSGQE